MSFLSTGRFNTLFQSFFDRTPDPNVSHDKNMGELCADLLSTRSESEERRLARAILLKYHHASDTDRRAYFNHWLNDMDIDVADLGAAVLAYDANRDPAAYAAMTRAMRAPRIQLFRKLAQVNGGAKCLVKIRQDIRQASRETPALKRLESDLFELLSAWFNRGFLVLEPINWETPANVLEKIIAYEAVHTINGWDDLRRRLQPPDRRCYGFFHPRMPDDPIIFVEVALTPEIPGSVDDLLAQGREPTPFADLKTATFYSISNCHPGLAGISFGNALIKQVVRLLQQELPQLDTFVTLSPIPGMSKWVDDDATPNAALGATYLTQAKRDDGLPLDPVTRFHLGNGALVHAVHEGANSSPAGMKQSFGMMVNYLYDLEKVDANADAFAKHLTVAMSKQVRQLIKP